MSFIDDLKGRTITLWKGGVQYNPPFPEFESLDDEDEKAQSCPPCIDIKEDNDTST
jgi:hypothetical protein